MKFKNINIAERHFEKAALLVALAAAGFFVYRNYVESPNVVELVEPGQVESRMTAAVDKLNMLRNKQARVTPSVPDWFAEYRSSSDIGLPPKLLVSVPTMAPLNVAPKPIGGGAPPPTPIINEPDIRTAVLTNPAIESARMLAVVPGKPDGRDITYVRGQAVLPLADLRQLIESANLPPEFHNTAIYRIHVQRQERKPDGSWSEWIDVPPLALNHLPEFNAAGVEDSKDLPARMAALRTGVRDILWPAFYSEVARPETGVAPTTAPQPGNPPHLPAKPAGVVPPGGAHPGTATPRPVPNRSESGASPAAQPSGDLTPRPWTRSGATPVAQPSGDLTPRPWTRSGAGAAVGPSGGLTPPPAHPGVPAWPPSPVLTSQPAPTPGQPGGPAVAAGVDVFGLNNVDKSVPVCFWDDQVQPEHNYRYQARVEIINPLFHLTKPLETLPAEGREQALLATAWTAFKEVGISADEYFFLSRENIGLRDPAAYFRMYKWYRGAWAATSDRVEVGAILGAKYLAPDVSFSRTYTVVDIVNIDEAAGSNLQVVLLNTQTGQLIMRDLQQDIHDPQYGKLESQIPHKPGLHAAGGITPAK